MKKEAVEYIGGSYHDRDFDEFVSVLVSVQNKLNRNKYKNFTLDFYVNEDFGTLNYIDVMGHRNETKKKK